MDPVGWHNYKMPIDDSGVEKAWLMNRGHLVGYQFSGLDNELRNLTPMTVQLNTGACQIRIPRIKLQCCSMRIILRIGLMRIRMIG